MMAQQQTTQYATRRQRDGLHAPIDGTAVPDRDRAAVGVIESALDYAGPRAASYNGYGRYGWVYRVCCGDGTVQWAFADDLLIGEAAH